MSAPRFTLIVAGRILDQNADGTWHITDKPDSFGFPSYAAMEAETGIKPASETLTEYGDGAPGESIAEIITALVTQLPAYRATLKNIGGLMRPIVNQSWCPDVEEHQVHIQCGECNR